MNRAETSGKGAKDPRPNMLAVRTKDNDFALTIAPQISRNGSSISMRVHSPNSVATLRGSYGKC